MRSHVPWRSTASRWDACVPFAFSRKPSLGGRDRFDFPDAAHRERQEIVNPPADLSDHTCSDEQLMTDHLGIGRHFLQSRYEAFMPAHAITVGLVWDARGRGANIGAAATAVKPIARGGKR